MVRRRTNAVWLLATFAVVAGLAAFSLWDGPTAIRAPWDTISFLDGGYRITEGQVPSSDFSNPIGPLLYGLISIGMRMESVPSLAAVTYGNLIFLVIACAIAGWVAHRRLPAPAAAAFTVFVALLTLSVRPLGYSTSTLTYAMLYNRYGWVLFATLSLLTLLRPRADDTPRTVAADGAALGVLLGLLFYDKINFFVVAVATVGMGLVLKTLVRRVLLLVAALVGFGTVVLTMWLLFSVTVTAYLGDVARAGESQSIRTRAHLLVDLLRDNVLVSVVALAVVSGYVLASRRRGATAGEYVPPAAAAVFVLGASYVISAGDQFERADIPGFVVVPLVIAMSLGTLHRSSARGWVRPGLVMAGLVALVAVTAGPLVVKDSAALADSVSLRGYVHAAPASQRFASSRLRDFVIPADSHWNTAYRPSNQVPQMVNDGLAMLREHVRRTDTVVTVAETDPFSFPLRLRSGRGPLWWDLYFNFDRSNHPTAQRVFGGAQWVMIPVLVSGEGCCQYTVHLMLDIYHGYLAAHFRQVQEDNDWILMHRVS